MSRNTTPEPGYANDGEPLDGAALRARRRQRRLLHRKRLLRMRRGGVASRVAGAKGTEMADSKRSMRDRLLSAMDAIRECDSEDDRAWEAAWLQMYRMAQKWVGSRHRTNQEIGQECDRG